MPMEAWIPTGPPYKPMPPMHSWFWREGFETQSAETIATIYHDCRQRRANLLLNLSPDKTGRLPDEAVETMRQVKRFIRS
jgi:alpha-L-fucosidase